MRDIDVTPYCEERTEGKEKILYLNWAKCMDLLHEHGAEVVYFEPIKNHETGSSLISSGITFKDSKDNTNSVYETAVRIVIDDKVFDFQGPVMNGANPVKDNSMSQQRLWNSQCRLFVKGVAIHTGLGFDLWLDNEEKEQKVQKIEDTYHDIMKVRERVLQEFTSLNKKGYGKAEISEMIGMTEDDLDMKFKMYASLANMEKKLVEALGKVK
jgi:hypothetical protein